MMLPVSVMPRKAASRSASPLAERASDPSWPSSSAMGSAMSRVTVTRKPQTRMAIWSVGRVNERTSSSHRKEVTPSTTSAKPRVAIAFTVTILKYSTVVRSRIESKTAALLSKYR